MVLSIIKYIETNIDTNIKEISKNGGDENDYV
jgi:hypothetical protein